MAFRKNRHFHGLLINWLISYALILLISFLFILSGYLLLSRNLRDETFRVHQARVQQAQISLDYLLSEIQLITSEIILLPEFRSLGGFTGKLGPRQYYLKYQLMVGLSKFHGSHPAIETVYVYFWPGDYIVSSYAAYDTSYYYNELYSQSSIEFADWKDLLTRPGDFVKTVSVLQSKSKDEPAYPHIQFITSGLPMFDPLQSGVSIVVTVKEDTIRRLVSGTGSGGEFYVVDSDDDVFLADASQTNLPSYLDLVGDKSNVRTIGNKILTHFPSKLLNWQIVSLSNQSDVESRLTRLRWIIFALVAFFWIVGTVLAYVFARRNYRPVTRLIDMISGVSPDSEVVHFRREEYRYIEESFNRLRQEKASIQDQLTVQQEAIRMQFLSRLLQGKVREESHSVEEQCELHGLYFEEDAFIAVVLQMEDTVLSNSHLEYESGATWLSGQIKSVLSEYTSGNGWALEVNNLSVLLINLQTPSDDPQLILAELLDELKDRLLRETGMTYTIGSSSYKNDLLEIPLAYEEAVEALAHRMVRGKGASISYYDIAQSAGEPRIFSTLLWARRFSSLLASGNYKDADRLIQSFLDTLEGGTNLSRLRIRLFSLVDVVIDTLSDILDQAIVSTLNAQDRLLGCTTLDEIRSEMKLLLQQIQEQTNGRQTTPLEERVSAIIDERYADPNLSVSYIAEQLDLSISNFSWLYKEETGTGPLDRIHRARLGRAKLLLHESDSTVKEIAAECGYLSDIAFIRVFKKYEGMTPGRFRNLSQPLLAK